MGSTAGFVDGARSSEPRGASPGPALRRLGEGGWEGLASGSPTVRVLISAHSTFVSSGGCLLADVFLFGVGHNPKGAGTRGSRFCAPQVQHENNPERDYQSGSWILLNGLGCSQPVRYRTPNRRAPNLPSRRFEAQLHCEPARVLTPPSAGRRESGASTAALTTSRSSASQVAVAVNRGNWVREGQRIVGRCILIFSENRTQASRP